MTVGYSQLLAFWQTIGVTTFFNQYLNELKLIIQSVILIKIVRIYRSKFYEKFKLFPINFQFHKTQIEMYDNLGQTNISSSQLTKASRQLLAYRQINSTLKKKLKANSSMQSRSIFSYVQEKNTNSPQHFQSPQRDHSDFSLIRKKLIHTQKKNKQKQNSFLMDPQTNIFKNPSSKNIANKIKQQSKQQMRLPSLQKRSSHMKQNILRKVEKNNSTIDNLQKPKVFRIPIERLKPLNAAQVRKKFELKIMSQVMQKQEKELGRKKSINQFYQN